MAAVGTPGGMLGSALPAASPVKHHQHASLHFNRHYGTTVQHIVSDTVLVVTIKVSRRYLTTSSCRSLGTTAGYSHRILPPQHCWTRVGLTQVKPQFVAAPDLLKKLKAAALHAYEPIWYTLAAVREPRDLAPKENLHPSPPRHSSHLLKIIFH